MRVECEGTKYDTTLTSQGTQTGERAVIHMALITKSVRSLEDLGMRDKLGIGRAMLAMLRAKPSPEWDQESAGDWFLRTRQTRRALDRFWRQDAQAPIPTFVDTGATLIDKNNLTNFRRASDAARSGN